MLIALAAWNILRNGNEAGTPEASPLRSLKSQADDAPLGEVLFLAGALSINNIAAGLLGGVGERLDVSLGLIIFTLSVIMLSTGLAIGRRWEIYARVFFPLQHPAFGDGVLAFAGIIMVADR